MEQGGMMNEAPKFATPQEELEYLRERVAQKEQELWQEQAPARPEAAISSTIAEYAKESPEQKLEEHLLIENPQFEAVVEHLGSLPHREKMRELYHVLAEKGVLNAIKVTHALENPHIEDDFHRVLVEYVRTGAIVPGLDRERALAKLLHMVVYEVTLPFAGMREGEKALTFKEVILLMERFFSGMIPLEGASSSNYGHFSLELVLSNFSNDIVFYISVEEHMKDLFVKQLLGAFPMARIEEHSGDYNIFNEYGVSVGSYAEQVDRFVYPIKNADESEQDPFTTILNSFTKIERDGEGAAIQIMVYPDHDKVLSKVKHALSQIKQGVSVRTATDIPLSASGVLVKTFREFVRTQVNPPKGKDAPVDPKSAETVGRVTPLIEEKISAPLLRANMRLVVSAPTRDRADAIRTSIESAFNQFARPHGNALKFTHAEKGRLKELLHNFTYRIADDGEALILSTKELATLYHLPVHVSQTDVPQLKTVKASSAPAPVDLPSDGVLLGVNKYRGDAREVRMETPDRLRHLYVIGQTGTGKTTLLKNMIVEDIKAGNGVCFIDPHGSDVQDILANIPKERIEDVIYFDPAYTARPFALNMLEYDINKPEQKIFVVNEMLSIFRKLYEAVPESMGPAFEQYFRNATMLVMEDPETGNTLVEIPRVLADKNFRQLKLSRCKNPIVVQFWREIAEKTSGETGLANMIPYITNKFDVFLSNDIMRPIIAQEKSSFNFRDIMDNKKILLVNLSKGRLGELNANLIGLVLVGKILMAALSRVDSYGKQLPNFYLYIDEFQNISTDSISAILSEARKYGLSLNIAHQFIAQLQPNIKEAVFGNVGSMAVFRVGAEDAQFLESQFAPTFKVPDIMKIENHNAYMKMLIHGKPVTPFNIETLPPPKGSPDVVEAIKNLSYLKFGKERKSVDDAIMRKYLSASTSPSRSATPAPSSSGPASTPQPSPSPEPSQSSIASPVSVARPAPSLRAPSLSAVSPSMITPIAETPAPASMPIVAPVVPPASLPVSSVVSGGQFVPPSPLAAPSDTPFATIPPIPPNIVTAPSLDANTIGQLDEPLVVEEGSISEESVPPEKIEKKAEIAHPAHLPSLDPDGLLTAKLPRPMPFSEDDAQ